MKYKNMDPIVGMLCPICGGQIRMHTIAAYNDWRVQCENHLWKCHIKGFYYKDQRDALKFFNKYLAEVIKERDDEGLSPNNS